MSDVKRAAIVGTAPSWNQTPWDDPGLYIVSLNDAYSLGVPRADAWYDTHPFDQMWFRPKDKHEFRPDEIPRGAYVRPEGHLEWLQKTAASIPVWLQQVPDGWPVNAQRFPIEEVKAFLKARPDQECYSASSPTLILAHLILQGYREISIYGIHLATQAEYVEQRPNFEWLMGKAEAMGVNLIIPPECPLLKHSHVYAYEQKPTPAHLEAVKRQRQVQKALNQIGNELIQWPRWKSKAGKLAEMARLRAELRDAQQQARFLSMQAGG